MKQVVQSVRDGSLRVIDLPRPQIGPTQVLVATHRSLVSAGTERAVRRLAGASLLAKARARPDLVRQVVRRARTDGLGATAQAVAQRLDEDMPLGYSAMGTVEEVGEHVGAVAPGQRVATAGAPHAGFQAVAGLLAVPLPDEVGDEEAAFATVAAIALQGLRLAEVAVGGRVVVVGLGLVGQLAVRLAVAAGLDVAGVDVRPAAVARAETAGARALVEDGTGTDDALAAWSRGRGADAVLVCAATESSDPVRAAARRLRDRGTLVVVGDVGLELERGPLYERELTLRVARSYGPGRYDPSYEGWAVDYPIGHVRWTEGRNLEAVVDLLARGRVRFADLVTHERPVEEAADAYALLEADTSVVGLQLTYGETARSAPTSVATQAVTSPPRTDTPGAAPPGIGLLGAGTFVRATLVPAMDRAGLTRRVAVSSASGVSAHQVAARAGFERVVGRPEDLWAEPGVEVVLVATPHDTHAELVVAALEAGRHVFCEKPLALSDDELDRVAQAWEAAGDRVLMVGFNRRYAPILDEARTVLGDTGTPLVIDYRVQAGPVPAGHWYTDRRQGGRLLGEVCHFVDTCAALVGQRARPRRGVGHTGSRTAAGRPGAGPPGVPRRFTGHHQLRGGRSRRHPKGESRDPGPRTHSGHRRLPQPDRGRPAQRQGIPAGQGPRGRARGAGRVGVRRGSRQAEPGGPHLHRLHRGHLGGGPGVGDRSGREPPVAAPPREVAADQPVGRARATSMAMASSSVSLRPACMGRLSACSAAQLVTGRS